MQDRRLLQNIYKSDEIPSSAVEVNKTNCNSISGNVLYVPNYLNNSYTNVGIRALSNGTQSTFPITGIWLDTSFSSSSLRISDGRLLKQVNHGTSYYIHPMNIYVPSSGASTSTIKYNPSYTNAYHKIKFSGNILLEDYSSMSLTMYDSTFPPTYPFYIDTEQE